MFSCTNNSQTTLKNPAYDMGTVSTWYKVNSMNVSSKKFQFTILIQNPRQSVKLSINHVNIWESQK